MAMYSYGTEIHTNSKLIFDKWVIGDCAVTPKNINHPLIQEFFTSMGAKAQVHEENYILITGNVLLQGPDLHNFLMQRGIDLRATPSALDVKISNYTSKDKSFTPNFTEQQESLNVTDNAISAENSSFTPSYNTNNQHTTNPEETSVTSDEQSNTEAKPSSWFSSWFPSFR